MKNSILLIIIVVILASTNYAQLDITTFTNKRVYEYGEKIELYCKITNNADTTFEFFAPTYQSCQAEFSFNDFKSWEHTGCLATVELLTFTPHTSKIYKWVIDPTKTGLPNNEGTQKIICSYYFNLADTFFIDAPQYLGGQLSVAYNLENSDSIQLIKDSLNIVLMEQHYYNNIVNEIWQVEGFQTDSLINKYKNDTLFKFIENPTFIEYDSIYSVYSENPLDYYPLHVGDKWYYKVEYIPAWVINGQTFYYLTREVIKDTTFSENKVYYVIKETRSDSNLINYFYERIDSLGGKIYKIDKSFNDGEEFLKIDLSIDLNESFYSWNKYGNSYLEDKITLNEISNAKIFKSDSEVKVIKIFNNEDSETLHRYSSSLANGIGEYNKTLTYLDAFDEYYTLKAAYINNVNYGDTTLVGVNENYNSKIPTSFSLSQNYPNPFNPITTIEYSIPVKNENFHSLQLIIYDVLGKEIRTLVNLPQKAGIHRIEFDGSDLASGIYYYQIKTENFIITKKMILLK